MQPVIIRITDLLLRTIIGGNEWEQEAQQEVVINITYSFDAEKALQSDAMEDTVDYKLIKKRIIEIVEHSSCRLIETLANRILSLIMDDSRILTATVRVDKPGALRFAKTVSAELSSRRNP